MRKLYTSLFLAFLFLPIFSLAQQNGVNKEKYKVSIKRAVDKVEIDGKLNEESWKTANVAKQFHYKWPKDEGVVPLQTEVRLTYDDEFLYVAATCKDRDTSIRIGYQHLFQTFQYSIFPKNEDSKINFHRIGVENFMVWDKDWNYNYRSTEFFY